MAQHFLQLNENKTEGVLFGPPDSIKLTTSSLGNLSTLVKPQVKNLGVIFDSVTTSGNHLAHWRPLVAKGHHGLICVHMCLCCLCVPSPVPHCDLCSHLFPIVCSHLSCVFCDCHFSLLARVYIPG